MAQIFLIGFYEEREFALYVSSISNELKVPVRYLKEDKPHGSAGGIYYFKDLIMEDGPVSLLCLILLGLYTFMYNNVLLTCILCLCLLAVAYLFAEL